MVELLHWLQMHRGHMICFLMWAYVRQRDAGDYAASKLLSEKVNELLYP